MNQRELAKKLSVSALLVRKLESAEHLPDSTLLDTLMQQFKGLAAFASPVAAAAIANEPLQTVQDDHQTEATRVNVDGSAFVSTAKASSSPQASAEFSPFLLVQSAAATLIGQTVRGYEFIEQIGEGGFGAVFRARQSSLGRDVAIKVVKPELANDADFIRRFEAEAELVARLEHPHIVPLYDFWREPNAAFMVMRMLKGGSLSQFMHAKLDTRPALKLLPLLRQISEALQAAHFAGVIHRDFKPANILLDEQGNACLADFGVAKQLNNDSGRTMIGEVVGSIAYCAPEQLRSEAVSPATDVYALGLVTFELLAGRRPFSATQPALMIEQHLSHVPPRLDEFVADTPPAISAILAQCLQKDPALRPQTAVEFVRELESALRGVDSNWLVHSRISLDEFATPTTFDHQFTEQDNPYRGLASFDESDAPNFFGREALVEQLLEKMSDRAPHQRMLMVIGPSGSGKSSAVRAGLVPSLRKGAIRGSEKWFISTFMPGPDPIASLAAALRRVAIRDFNIEALLNRDSFGLSAAIDRCLPNEPGAELLLIVDQFEELFTLCADEKVRAHWLSLLTTTLLDTHCRLRIILTLRADFLDRPLQYPDLAEIVRERTALVPAMSLDELERAIVGPARRVGLVFEDGLVPAILEEVTDQLGALPLLQFSLSELFTRRKGRELKLAIFRKMGGVKGALAGRAETAFASLDSTAQTAARQMFLRLTSLGEGSEDTRRRARQYEIDAMFPIEPGKTGLKSALTAFGGARLLTFDRDASSHENTLEVAHEALLRSWSRLREWLQSSRSALRLQRQLHESAKHWQANQKDVSFLLSGNRLAQFSPLLPNAGDEPKELNPGLTEQTCDVLLTDSEAEFLQRSLAYQQSQDDQEAQRAARELAGAQALAEQQTKAAELARESVRVQQRGNLRLRWLSAGLTSILALAIWQSVQIKQRSKALELETTRANVEAKSAFALSEFWQTLFTNADPNLAKGRELTVKDVLGEAATKLHLSLKDAPQARARLQLTIAQTYRQLGDFAAAELAADGALDAVPLGVDDALRVQIQLERGRALADAMKTVPAIAALAEAKLLQDKLGAPALERATTINIWASILNDTRKFDEAIVMLKEGLALREKNAAPSDDIASSAGNLAFALRQLGQLSEAQTLFSRVLALRIESLGQDHIETALAAFNLAKTERELGDFTAAEQHYTQSIAIFGKLFPDPKSPHPAMNYLRLDLAIMKNWQNQPNEALVQIELVQKTLPESAYNFSMAVQLELARTYLSFQKTDLALTQLSQCIAVASVARTAGVNLVKARCYSLHAEILFAQNQPVLAQQSIESAIAILKAVEYADIDYANALLIAAGLAKDEKMATAFRADAKALLIKMPEQWRAKQLLKGMSI